MAEKEPTETKEQVLIDALIKISMQTEDRSPPFRAISRSMMINIASEALEQYQSNQEG